MSNVDPNKSELYDTKCVMFTPKQTGPLREIWNET